MLTTVFSSLISQLVITLRLVSRDVIKIDMGFEKGIT